MEKYSAIGNNLRQARIFLKLKQAQVAEIIGCKQQAIGKIEVGKMHGKTFVDYLIFLEERGIDINKVLSSQVDFIQQ